MKHIPTTERGWKTVSAIREAACVLFGRQGIRATTLDQVEERAGVGRSQLYHFYEGRSDLVADVVAVQVERVLAAQRPLLDQLASADDVNAWCALVVELNRESDDPVRCPIGSLVNELGDGDPAARMALADGFECWRASLAEGLRRVQAEGQLVSSTSPDEAALLLLAAYQGGIIIASATDNIDVLAATLDRARAAVLAS